jgi:hypothetical protein
MRVLFFDTQCGYFDSYDLYGSIKKLPLYKKLDTSTYIFFYLFRIHHVILHTKKLENSLKGSFFPETIENVFKYYYLFLQNTRYGPFEL